MTTALGLSTVNGLPAHVLLVHFVVVLVPLAGIALVAALRPAWAHRMGWWLPALGIAAFVSVLLAMNAGGWLQNHVPNTALVRRHTHLAGQLWPLSAAVALLSVAVWWLTPAPTAARNRPGQTSSGPTTRIVIGALSVVLAVISIVQVIRIGDSGSRAAWTGHFSSSSAPKT